MKLARALHLAVPVAALSLATTDDARACGGCFVPPADVTVVSGHVMALSISTTQTTLWDQISYSGDPTSFAWVLPLKGIADIGLSSDAMFNGLGTFTQIQVSPPYLECLNYGGSGSGSGGTGGAGGGGGGVTIVSQKVVGPYETVQLKSTDPAALQTWLASHGYQIPNDIKPIVSAYVNEGFDFLALKLVPGMSVAAMRPVRVTTAGATPVLPLRMVAAGTGAKTPITLFVLGEGRYEPVNLPKFEINAQNLIWDWDTYSSNYSLLVDQGFTASDHKGWLIEGAYPFSKFQLDTGLHSLVSFDPTNSGYGDDMGVGAEAELDADLDKLFGKISDTSLWVTRMRGELSREALGADLQLGASASQTEVSRFLQAGSAKGTAPCTDGSGGGAGSGGSGGTNGGSGGGKVNGNGGDYGFESILGGGNKGKSESGGCATTTVSRGDLRGIALGGFAVALAALGARRRRSRDKQV